MSATKSDIERWLDRLYADEQLTHMVVRADSFDGDCYPVYVTRDESVRARAIADNGDRVMEVYSANYTREEQMAQARVFNYD